MALAFLLLGHGAVLGYFLSPYAHRNWPLLLGAVALVFYSLAVWSVAA